MVVLYALSDPESVVGGRIGPYFCLQLHVSDNQFVHFGHSFIQFHSFIHSFVRSIIYLSIRSRLNSSINPFIFSAIYFMAVTIRTKSHGSGAKTSNLALQFKHVAKISSRWGANLARAQGTPTKNRKLLGFGPLFFGPGQLFFSLFLP